MKQYIIYDILNNMYFWEFRGEQGFDLDINEATKYSLKEQAEEMIQGYSNSFERVLEIKEVYYKF